MSSKNRTASKEIQGKMESTEKPEIDTNNFDYDTCDECKVFRTKKWKLCAKCGNAIEYFEDTRSKLNMKLGDILPVNETVLFLNTFIIDVSDIKLGHPHDKVLNIGSSNFIGYGMQLTNKNGLNVISNPFNHPDWNNNQGNKFQRNKYIPKTFKDFGFRCMIYDQRHNVFSGDDSVWITQLIDYYIDTGTQFHGANNFNIEMKHGEFNEIRSYTLEKIIKLLVKNRIFDPLCINFDMDMVQYQKIDDKTCKLIITETKNGNKAYTRDNFKFLDDIKCTLYYSQSKDRLFTYDELKQYFDVEFKVYKIKINEYSDMFKLRNIRVRILNEKFERLFYFADLRHTTTGHIPKDFEVKEEHSKHHLLTLLYLLGLENC